MAEPITDPDLIKQLDATRLEQDRTNPNRITDPLLTSQLDKTRQRQDANAAFKDFGKQAPAGFVESVIQNALLPLKVIGLAKSATNPEGYEAFKQLTEQAPAGLVSQDLGIGNPEGPAGRYGRAIGGAIGSQLPMTGGLIAAGKQLPALVGPAIERPAQRFGERLLRGMAERPKATLGYDVLGAGGAAAAQQYAAEEDAPWPVQLGAGLAGGIVAPMSLAGGVRYGAPVLKRLMGHEGGAGPLPTGLPGGWSSGGGRPGEPPPPAPPGAPPPAPGAFEPISPRNWEGMAQYLADEATAAGMRPAEFDEFFNKLAEARTLWSSGKPPDASVIADVNDAMARAVAAQVRLHKGAANIGRTFVTARQTGLEQPRPLHPEAGIETYHPMELAQYGTGEEGGAAGQWRRVIEATERGTLTYDKRFHGFGKNAEETAQILSDARDKASDLNYGAFRSAARGELEGNKAPVNLRNEPAVTEPVNKWLTEANTVGERAEDARKAIGWAMDQFAPGGKVLSNPDRFDQAKRIVDNRIDQMLHSADVHERETGRMLMDLRRDIVDNGIDLVETNNLGTLYKAARDVHSGHEKTLGELRMGRELYEGTDPQKVRDNMKAFDKLDHDGQKLVRHGFVSAMAHEVKGKNLNADTVRAVINTPERMERLAKLIPIPRTPKGRPREQVNPDTGERELVPGAERPQRLGSYYQFEQASTRTGQHISGGAQTAERGADQKAADALHQVVDVISAPGVVGKATEFMKQTLTRLFGIRADRADAIVRVALSADPDIRARAIADIQMRMGSSRAMRLAEILDRYRAQSVVPAITGAEATPNRAEPQ